jgi:signal peptidase
MNDMSFLLLPTTTTLGSQQVVTGALRVFRAAIATALALILLLTVALALASLRSNNSVTGPRIFGKDVLVVRSGSMTGTFAVGSAVVMKPISETNAKSLGVGSIVSFKSAANPNVLITHRIVETITRGDGRVVFRTKGDVNKSVDQTFLDPSQVVSKYSFAIPRGGFLLVAIQSGRLLAALAIAFILASVSLMFTNRAFALSNQLEIL